MILPGSNVVGDGIVTPPVEDHKYVITAVPQFTAFATGWIVAGVQELAIELIETVGGFLTVTWLVIIKVPQALSTDNLMV